MTENTARQPFAIHVVWHPGYPMGRDIAEWLHKHFGSDLYRGVVGGAGVPVLFYTSESPGAPTPPRMDWGEAEVTAVVVLISSTLSKNAAWKRYVQTLVDESEARDACRVFPVSMDENALEMGLGLQAVRWDKLPKGGDRRRLHLCMSLTHEFSILLRDCLGRPRNPGASAEPAAYEKKVSVFLSHSKHDGRGEKIADGIRDWIQKNSRLSGFLDVEDIPPGASFSDSIKRAIQGGAMLIIYTDSYSSRKWCRYETLEAKRVNAPLLVTDCLRGTDERIFPYMGNVPVVRFNRNTDYNIRVVVARLLDEVFRDFLWRYGTERFHEQFPQIVFIPKPPELISLVSIPEAESEKEQLIVYPDPPLGEEETEMFSTVGRNLRLRSMKQWRAEACV